ncbi:MAG: 1,4-dihydroxy-6-naphthoate synthase [Bacteroidota bacterium]
MSAKKLTLGFSPCPNDCFIFDALVHGRIDTEGLEFDLVMEDVEALNRKAFDEKIDITKLSYHAFAHLTGTYILLDAGSALGFGVGPLLIASREYALADVPTLRVAIPGRMTTANFLFSLAFPGAKNKTELLFSDIEGAVLEGKADAGVIIHENRFTYQEKGLKKLLDLGEWWERETGTAIPLGGIAMKRSFPAGLQQRVSRIIRRSVEYAFAHPKASYNFVKANAQEMDEEVMYRHIGLYVNEFSADLGPEGKKAVRLLLQKAQEANLVEHMNNTIFLDQ